MSKVYGYCRVALRNEEAIAEQIKLIDTYCKNNCLKVDQYFCDNGASGITLNRKELNAMLNILQDGDMIIMKDIARLSRNMFQCMELIEQIEEDGAILEIIK